MEQEGFKRKLAAIFSADVEAYSRLMRDNEEATVRDLAANRLLIAEIIKHHNGRVVDSPGDNILAEFASVVDAVNGAIKIQKKIRESNKNVPETRRMEFRIGINLSDVIEEEGRIYGDGVNIAARVEGLAAGGGIAISGTVYEHIKDKLSLGYHYLGEQDVKNIPEPVRVFRILTEPADAGKMIGTKKPKASNRRYLIFGVLALVILVAAALVIWNYYFRIRIEPASVEKMAYPLPDKPSIAVLPFANMSGDKDQEYFADGITEDIITDLSKVSGLFVVARNSTFVYKGKAVKIREIAEDLGVRYILEGSVRRSIDRMRINVQLIDALKGSHVWAERYDREHKDLFAIEDDVSHRVVSELAVTLKATEQERMFRRHTENLEAYETFLHARRILDATEEDTLQARQLFERVIELDPSFAGGYAGLSLVLARLVRHGFSTSPKEDIERSFELARRAVSTDDKFGWSYLALGSAYLNKREHDKAISAMEEMIRIQPSSADAYMFMGFYLHWVGRSDEAIESVKKSMRLNPGSIVPAAFILGMCYFTAGRYDDAIATINQKYTYIARKGNIILCFLAASYAAKGEYEKSREVMKVFLEKHPNFALLNYPHLQLYKRNEDRDRYANFLRKAGLPEHPPLPLPDKPSIAVLPFTNMSDDPEQEYFSDGISEEIITALSKTPKLFVIARNSTFTYKGKPVKVQQVGRELGVKYVLEGSVRKDKDRVRIAAQLVDAQTGNHIWAERYDKDLKDVFSIQDEITLEIIKALQVELTAGETARVTGKGTNNLDSYLMALHAQEQWLRMDKEGSIKARQFAMKAIALDPEYGYPYAIVAWCHMLDVVRQYTQSTKESMRLAVEAIQKALALDESDHRIHRALSNLYVMQGKHDEAIASSKRALELCPGGAGPYENLGIALLFACRPSEAIPMLEKAIALDPFPPAVFHRNLAMAYQHVGRYEDAILEGKKAFQLNPNDLSTPIGLVSAYAKLGRMEEARAAAAEVLRINPNFTLDSFAETRARMFATKCQSDRVNKDVEFIGKADVGLK